MKHFIVPAIASILLLSCAPQSVDTGDVFAPPTSESKDYSLIPSVFGDVPGWNDDDLSGFATAYQRSCTPLLKRNSQSFFGKDSRFGKNQEWQILCRKFNKINQNHQQTIRRFFEDNFTPHLVISGVVDQDIYKKYVMNPMPLAKSTGLFTGYYEAALNGSRTKQGAYQYPLRARPSDLVMVDLGKFRDELKGQRIAGRVNSGRLSPYESHEEIINGELPADQDKPLVWVDDPIDAFFIQIQGSGTITLDDGTMMRVGYAGQNGHPYYAIGRELIAMGVLTKDTVSMQSIRAWMEANPDKAQDLMIKNKSYVFFKEIEGEGPVGGSGIALTPLRSLAIDHSIIPYHMPVWLGATHPRSDKGPINRLMVTQDTGGAIRGAIRGDVFWGFGSEAEDFAGEMKSQGRYWFLLPKFI